MTYIPSEGDPRLSYAQAWVEEHLNTLAASTGQTIRALDCSDDCLELALLGFPESIYRRLWVDFLNHLKK